MRVDLGGLDASRLHQMVRDLHPLNAENIAD
jgi:hypothetical protein